MVSKFDLKYVQVLNRILEKEDAMIELLDQNQLNPSRKRFRMGKNELLDNNLNKFMISVRDKNGEISTNDLQVKSVEIALKLNIENFKGSKGFVHNWKKRFNIKFKNFSGEGGSVDDIIVDGWFSHLCQLLKQYDSQFVYNLDETGLYWKAGKGKSFITGAEAKDKDLRGTKMNKDRLTVLVGGSMTGEKLPLLVIGKSKKPRCFNGIKNLPLDYTNQENSWMNSTIFNNYLLKLDKRLSSLLEPNKKALLIVDNYRAHPPSLASNYKNIDLKFFPPNITSRAQPMDMGIIHSLKSHYKNALSKRKNAAIDNKIQLNFSLLEWQLFF